MPGGPATELRELKSFVSKIERRFLTAHLKQQQPLAMPTEGELHDTAAYVALAHGAFEDFIEGVAEWLRERVTSRWSMDRRVPPSLATLMLFVPPPTVDFNSMVSIADHLREALKQANKVQSDAVFKNNGIELRHIRTLLVPLGVEVPEDPQLAASLDRVVKMRHEWAHQFRHGAVVLTSASDTKRAVDDCLVFAERLVDAVQRVRL